MQEKFTHGMLKASTLKTFSVFFHLLIICSHYVHEVCAFSRWHDLRHQKSTKEELRKIDYKNTNKLTGKEGSFVGGKLEFTDQNIKQDHFIANFIKCTIQGIATLN